MDGTYQKVGVLSLLRGGDIAFITDATGDPGDPWAGTIPKMVIKGDGNVGIGTIDPQSALQVTGYTQLDLTSGAPPTADCDEASERGRMKVDSGAGLLWVCVDSGWVAK